MIVPEPEEVILHDGDRDEDGHPHHHRVEHGADLGHVSARGQIRGHVAEYLLEYLRREVGQAGGRHGPWPPLVWLEGDNSSGTAR